MVFLRGYFPSLCNEGLIVENLTYTDMQKRKPELEFLTGREAILDVLDHSQQHGNVIGICSPTLGPGIFITTVDHVLKDYETIIYLKPFDVNGYKLEKNVLKLTEIASVCPFRTNYEKLYHDQPKESELAGHYSF